MDLGYHFLTRLNITILNPPQFSFCNFYDETRALMKVVFCDWTTLPLIWHYA